jgi:transposase
VDKPENRYRKGTVKWAVLEGDWADLTPGQIAEVLGVSLSAVRTAIGQIRRETGYDIPRVDGRKALWGYE